MTPETAGGILVQLRPTLDACRQLLAEAPSPRGWSKATASGRQEAVTELDLAVEQRIIAAVHAVHPKASVYSEESAHDPAALSEDLCVVLDPIDGTELLLRGESGYSISIAILSDRRVIAGLLDFPALDHRFVCTLGSGAELNGRPLRVLSEPRLTSARVVVSSTQHAAPSLQPLWRSLAVAELVPTPGFTAKMAPVLLGQCDGALYLPYQPRPTFIWDYAAAALLLSEAGGTLTTLQGEPFLDALPLEESGGWLAATTALHSSLLGAIQGALGQLPTHPNG